jgi:hypothetical protein
MTTKHFLGTPLALLCLAASMAQAQQPSEASGTRDAAGTSSASKSPTSTSTPAAAGTEARRVVRDPVTGRLRAPTEQELAAEQARTGATGPGEPLRVRVHANGMKSAVLGPDYMSTVIVERAADGRLVTRHANPRDEHARVSPATPSAARGGATE